MTKIIAYTALLYGTDYLGWAIRSVIDHIDELHILYDASGHGSHGHVTDRVCPDTREQLITIAARAAGAKMRWHDGRWAHEGYQRESIHQYAPDADVILVLDADEIWPRYFNRGCLDAWETLNVQRLRLPMIHFWRSFHRAVLHDPAFPERVIYPKKQRSFETVHLAGSICHLGYAQRSEIVGFKLSTHGHKGEFRRDVDWFNDVFMANRQLDCHPVGSEYWNPEPVNPWDYMPEFMKQHPYAELEVIP